MVFWVLDRAFSDWASFFCLFVVVCVVAFFVVVKTAYTSTSIRTIVARNRVREHGTCDVMLIAVREKPFGNCPRMW